MKLVDVESPSIMEFFRTKNQCWTLMQYQFLHKKWSNFAKSFSISVVDFKLFVLSMPSDL